MPYYGHFKAVRQRHGLKANRKIVETFVRYAHDQGYISREIPTEELFVPSLLDT